MTETPSRFRRIDIVLLAIVWMLSAFLDNIAGALIGGAMAHQLYRAKVHIGFIGGFAYAIKRASAC